MPPEDIDMEYQEQMNDEERELEEQMKDWVRVVHCKDCVHCADDWNGNQPQFTCELGLCAESIYPDDYCSYGERKEQEHE